MMKAVRNDQPAHFAQVLHLPKQPWRGRRGAVHEQRSVAQSNHRGAHAQPDATEPHGPLAGPDAPTDNLRKLVVSHGGGLSPGALPREEAACSATPSALPERWWASTLLPMVALFRRDSAAPQTCAHTRD